MTPQLLRPTITYIDIDNFGDNIQNCENDIIECDEDKEGDDDKQEIQNLF
jgi:hypothetical protein